MDEPVWSLRIVLSGNVELQVHGTKDSLMPTFEKFEGSQWDENERVRVDGFCNTADRATLLMCVKLSEVQAMTMFRED